MTASQHIALIVGDDRASGPRFTFEEAEINIGRGAKMDLQFETPTVSSHHARIMLHEGDYYLEDMGSTNGTFLNGRPLTRPHPLSTGDQIRLGKTVTLIFEALDGPAPAEGITEIEVGMTMLDGAHLVTADQDMPTPRLEVFIGGEYAGKFDLTGETLTLGRAPDNDIVINSGIVSRYLARLEYTGITYQISMLPEVSNPIMLGSHLLDEPLQLQDNDRLQIGGQNPATVVHLTYRDSSRIPTQTEGQVIPMARVSIEIDEEKRQQQFREITGSTFFRVLKHQAQRMREEADNADVTDA